MNGIYILANDFVYHQLIALINSIEVNLGTEMPICIIPYDDRLDKVRSEVANRPQVSLFETTESIQRWEGFATEVWKSHDRAQQAWRERKLPEVYRIKMHRKLCCFEGEFDKFIYFDADTLALGSVASIFAALDQYDWVTNDYQYSSDIKYIFDRPTDFDTQNIFCAGWFASKKGVFTDEILRSLLTALKAGEVDSLALWGTDQSLLNYMVLKSQISYYNLASTGTAPGSHWSTTFEEKDHILYDQGQRLMYLHYMSIAASKFNRLCQGEDVPMPYRELFLHYRYLKSPQDRPELRAPNRLTQARSQITRFYQQKLGNLNYRLRKLKQQLNKSEV